MYVCMYVFIENTITQMIKEQHIHMNPQLSEVVCSEGLSKQMGGVVSKAFQPQDFTTAAETTAPAEVG